MFQGHTFWGNINPKETTLFFTYLCGFQAPSSIDSDTLLMDSNHQSCMALQQAFISHLHSTQVKARTQSLMPSLVTLPCMFFNWTLH